MNCFALERVDAAKSGSVLPFDWYEMQEHVGWGVTQHVLLLHFYTFGRHSLKASVLCPYDWTTLTQAGSDWHQ